MRILSLFVFIIFTISINAQDTIEKTVEEFSTVKVFDLIHLKMIKSDENKVLISGDNRNEVELVNTNGILKIRMRFEKSYDGDDTVVVLYYTSVDTIDANEGATVLVKSPLKQYEVDLKVQEGAEITATLETTYANLRAVTGGVINVSGSSKNQDVTIYTGGELNAKDFITEQTKVSVNAGGEAYVHATTYADVRIKAGGNVYIYGKPKQIDERTVLGGKIKRM